MTDSLSAVCQPITSARGLPNAHYTDTALYARETEILLAGHWAGLAVASDVPTPGDAVPLSFCGQPLLLIRDKAGRVRVFQNVCRHRGMILVDQPRRIEGAIRCPYHSWCYGTDGRLVTTPHVGGPGQNTHDAIDRSLLGLIEVPSHIWMDVVFVNLSGTAPPFEEVHADLIARWRAFDQPLAPGGAESRFALQVNCNWKLAVENYCESYHLPWVHPGLNAISRLEDHYNIEAPGAYSGQGTEVYQQFRAPDGTPAFPDFEGLSTAWDTAAEYIAVYPNVLLGVHRDHVFSILLIPEDCATTTERVALSYARPDTAPEMRAGNAAQWKAVFEEDIFVVEGMQRGRMASGFDGGAFSPAMDGPTHCFHAWAASALQEGSRHAAE
ncbi:aromatic ring-hydroxylating oxygenase subunit alpha [Dinoroseobacter sp. S375]|uniref:aromatic ring-hydroxylating oxygenase subunit alpha n=1 Tax=Dinoroseobacter sp. S375 TaxID=3415136 RepID=UPI003C7EB8D9